MNVISAEKSIWVESCGFRKSLVSKGWKTPNTYDNCFAYPTDGSAVYLFLLHGWDHKYDLHDFDKCLVAYVGMSRQLSKRWSKHPTLREIEGSGRYVQKWFLPTEARSLRTDELDLIQKFNPPWNIQGRKRGLLL